MKTFVACALFTLVLEGTASAHVIDEYLERAQVAITPSGARVELRLTPGVDVADRVLGVIDRDGDGVISAAEENAYAHHVMDDVSLDIDGRRATLVLEAVTFPSPSELREGDGVLRIDLTAEAPLDSAGEHRLTFRNDHLPELGAYLTNVLSPTTDALAITGQRHDSLQHELDVTFRVAAAWRECIRCALVLGVIFVLLLPWGRQGAWRRRRAGAARLLSIDFNRKNIAEGALPVARKERP